MQEASVSEGPTSASCVTMTTRILSALPPTMAMQGSSAQPIPEVIKLSKHREQLDGIDQLFGRAGQRFDIRFHLHPAVSASIMQNGNSAILKLPKGGGWQFDSVGAELSLEDSIFLDGNTSHRSNSLWFRARPRPRRPKFPGRYTRLVNVSPRTFRHLSARDSST